jgi:hypothetical protein
MTAGMWIYGEHVRITSIAGASTAVIAQIIQHYIVIVFILNMVILGLRRLHPRTNYRTNEEIAI